MRQQLAYAGEGSLGPYMAETGQQRKGTSGNFLDFYNRAYGRIGKFNEEFFYKKPYKGFGLLGVLGGAAAAGPFGLATLFGALIGGLVFGGASYGAYRAMPYIRSMTGTTQKQSG